MPLSMASANKLMVVLSGEITFVNNHHEIIVTNSGTLAASENNMGFGIKSTRDRLKLIYQDNAYFEIKMILRIA